MSELVGQILDDRYRVLQQLGKGGMAEVYLAEHLPTGRKDAVKVMRGEFAYDLEILKRFRREARAINRLQHPNIVSIYDFGQMPDGNLFLAMEYVQGLDVRMLLQKEKVLAIDRVVAMMRQIADAVDHAHEMGVVHRDLKPGNLVLVDRRGKEVVKIIDFGISKISSGDNQTTGLTAQGEVIGSPWYMSPEQIGGSSAPSCDIYAIGCIAYELLVGEPAFPGRPIQVLRAQLHDTAAPPRQKRPEIPPALEAIILRLLEKDPKDRFASGSELDHALRGVPSVTPKAVPKAQPPAVPAAVAKPGRETLISTDTSQKAAAPQAGASSAAPADTMRGSPTGERYDVLLELGSALVTQGCDDVDLLLDLDSFRYYLREVGRVDEELATIERRMAEVEDLLQERQGMLRFTRADLQFAAEPTGPGLQTRQRRIGALEERIAQIAEAAERETTGLTDRAISLAALRDTFVESLRTISRSVQKLIEQVAPAYARDSQVQSLLSRLRSLSPPPPKSVPKQVRK